jgi:hypothetical protein
MTKADRAGIDFGGKGFFFSRTVSHVSHVCAAARVVILRFAALGALAISLLSAPAHASFAVPPNAPGQYKPRDDCAAIADATPFLAKVKFAVAARDVEAFAALASPEILLDFGGGSGRDELRRRFAPGSKMWAELDKIMALGCAIGEDTGALVIPWFFAQDLGDADPFSTVVALSSSVPLLAKPVRTARIRKILNWQLVALHEGISTPPGYAAASVIDSDWSGYVQTDRFRAQID